MEPRGASLGEAGAKLREVREGLGYAAGELRVRDEGDADLGGGDGGDVGLAAAAPVDLDEVGPRVDSEVLAEADAAGREGGSVQPG
jgi:hypothetical protein